MDHGMKNWFKGLVILVFLSALTAAGIWGVQESWNFSQEAAPFWAAFHLFLGAGTALGTIIMAMTACLMAGDLAVLTFWLIFSRKGEPPVEFG